MASSIVTKLGLGVLSASALSIGGLTIYSSLTPKTFGDSLSQEGHKLLEDTSKKWKKLVQEYEKSKSESGSNPTQIQGLDLNSEDKEKKLKEKCHELWNKHLSDTSETNEQERIKKELRSWCVKNPEAIKAKKK